MEKTFNLYFEDFFAPAVWQKIDCTGDREISYLEIRHFADIVENNLEKKGYKYREYIDGNIINVFLKKFENCITYDENAIRLNDDITYEESLFIFPVGILPAEVLFAMMDKNVGQQVFGKQIKSTKFQNNIEEQALEI